MEPMHTTTNEADELLRAELAVEQSRAELNRSLRRVSQNGEKLLQRVQAELKPGLVIGVAVVGALALTGVSVALARRNKKSHWLAPEQPSTFGVVAKAVGLWALRLAARNVAQALVARLEQSEPTVPAAAQAAQGAQ